MLETIAITVIGSLITGVVAAIGTVKALTVHIDYLSKSDDTINETLKEHDTRIKTLELSNQRG
ncbi:hypothetical protein HMF8227_01464 [Saliniradius amylolyticus]|uniref:Uncharacterized protein n=1 Tax=Saliniradius amylolyticus TaxID=2183582 RepID=A0A2S2E2W7_9ALTE|nr:hypothetical protein [Saliniradius amylolyticus]AWL11939.1 hypothetical protein HMF8227_01464 [Saliniradius amylolyticus]